MKSIFGFLAGAVIGAGGLLGLRKALTAMDQTQSPAPSKASNLSGATSSAVEPSPSKTEKTAVPSGKKNEAANTKLAPEASQDRARKPDETASLVGEPVARHTEPAAATQTDPQATSPRSETSEPAVPEEPEVKPAAKTAPDKVAKDSPDSSSKKSKKNRTKARSDDFTVIIDIGPVFNQKLHEAGIKSFKALAKLTPAEIQNKTGIPAERIENGQWIEQVQKLLGGEKKK